MRGTHWAVMLASSLALGADIGFMSAGNCTGQVSYGLLDVPHLPCQPLHELDGLQSIHVTNMTAGQTVKIFKDSACGEEVQEMSGDGCFGDLADGAGSFALMPPPDAGAVEPYDTRIMDLRHMNITSMDQINIRLDIGFAATLILSASSIGSTIYSGIGGCTNTGGDPLAISYCVLGILSYVFAAAAGSVATLTGQQLIENWRGATGQLVQARGDIAEMVDQMNQQYSIGVWNNSDTSYTHVGYMARDMAHGKSVTPLHEIDSEIGKLHLATFFDPETEDFLHHMDFSDNSQITARGAPFPYNGIRTPRGGVDFRICANGNDRHNLAGLDGGHTKVFNFAYDQIRCQLSNSQLRDAKGVSMDMHNRDGGLVGEVTVRSYSSTPRTPPACSRGPTNPINQGCMIK